MPTTTIRVDSETHARLVALSKTTGDSLIDTVRDAAEALRRQRFARQAAADVTALRARPDEWADYLAEAEATFVTDGIG
jgi:Tfp pilus assembly protein PilV